MNRVFLFLPLAIFLVLGVYFGLGLREDPSAIPSQMIDRPLPVFDLPGIADGEPGLASTDLAGHVSLLNVFGSWCPPCEIEHPMLMQISRSGRVPIYGVDWRDRPGDGAVWLARHGNPYQRAGDDAQGRVAIDLGITGAPESFLVDREGRVRFHHVGIIDETVWRDVLLPRIEALEAE
ncbi:DsbE family thiol:disulfide interchange protein [Maricaulis maris]|uniref:Cytochrome c biogenesis protein CcmG/thiol:disulfide interchange protein DsbE n=1 Tax=Maricaulis maris TaxID=74318 RepID=A0A495DJE7_9PROT|nr:DsbE family thiol:disulfide interchange protein [Maricaulis maris]RKR02702.1 cytochrome c biogenesis protein CcmG/thiol:disulfide interchange protein DsbE [Maricaulis maris]